MRAAPGPVHMKRGVYKAPLWAKTQGVAVITHAVRLWSLLRRGRFQKTRLQETETLLDTGQGEGGSEEGKPGHGGGDPGGPRLAGEGWPRVGGVEVLSSPALLPVPQKPGDFSNELGSV